MLFLIYKYDCKDVNLSMELKWSFFSIDHDITLKHLLIKNISVKPNCTF